MCCRYSKETQIAKDICQTFWMMHLWFWPSSSFQPIGTPRQCYVWLYMDVWINVCYFENSTALFFVTLMISISLYKIGKTDNAIRVCICKRLHSDTNGSHNKINFGTASTFQKLC